MANERKRVLKAEATKELLILRNLSKVYGTKFSSQYRLAVNQLCLKMKKAEVSGGNFWWYWLHYVFCY